MDEKRHSTDGSKETNQMLELSERNLKVAIIKTLKQIKILLNEKNRKFKQNSLMGSVVEMSEGKISELKYLSI